MKTIIPILALAVLCGCNNRQDSNPQVVRIPSGISVFSVDGCEYVVFDGVSKGGIVHKANCSNPIHIHSRPHISDPMPYGTLPYIMPEAKFTNLPPEVMERINRLKIYQ